MKVIIFGYGNMGQAIAKVLAKKAKVFIYDKNPTLASTAKKHSAFWLKNFSEIKTADFVIIAVKPKDMAGLAEQIKNYLSAKTILVSIAAGVPIKKISEIFCQQKIVRVMPNLGLTVGHGIAAWKFSASINKNEAIKVEKFLKIFTEGFAVKNEDIIDRVTAVSGSGPAYFFYLAWSLEQAARGLGFSKEEARMLVEKTFSGAACLQIAQDYSELTKKVASKKGTTEAALKVFSQHHIGRIFNKAILAAYKRAKELSV